MPPSSRLEPPAKRRYRRVEGPSSELRERPRPQRERSRRADRSRVEEPPVVVELRGLHSPQVRAQARFPERSLVEIGELRLQAHDLVARAGDLQPEQVILHVSPVL